MKQKWGVKAIEIKRDYYLNKLIAKRHNGLIKVVTGMRRCGKSYLLFNLFKDYLIENNVAADHIIEVAFDSFENIKYCDPEELYGLYGWYGNAAMQLGVFDQRCFYEAYSEVKKIQELCSTHDSWICI